MHKVETTIRSLVVKGVFIAFGLISAVALYYRDGKIHVAKNGNVIIEEFFSLYVLLYLLFHATNMHTFLHRRTKDQIQQ